jgi:glycosyltransferase involved in cell wall biosynthesis
MRKLAIDLTYRPTGGALAQIKEIIRNLDYYDFDEVVFYLTNDNRHFFDNVDNNKISLFFVPFSNKSIVIRTIWAQIILPFSLVFNKIDILFCPGNISPIFNSKKKVQWIGTVGPFERSFISFFGWKQKIILFATRYLMIFSSYTSDIVIFESNYTRDLFIRKYRQSRRKSVVIYIGNDEFFHQVAHLHSKNNNQDSGKDFILTVSHLYPYKNIELLLDSYYHNKLYQDELYLYIAGSISDLSYYNQLKSKIERYGISKFCIFLGRVEKDELRELYSECKMFVFTSPFENFAYTLVEAMSCSAPIIATNTTAMPETCGDAALYFSPNSEQGLSKCILAYLKDEDLRKQHKEKSLLVSDTYDTYSEVNRKTAELLERL